LIVGTVTFDAIETPFGKTDKILGGAAKYIGLSAANFNVTSGIVPVVGGDFPKEYLQMIKKYDNEFKVMIVELLNSGIKTKQVSEYYDLSLSMVGRWKREYKLKSGDFSKKKELSVEAQELKDLKKEFKNVTMEREILKKAVSKIPENDVFSS
jgi:transposase